MTVPTLANHGTLLTQDGNGTYAPITTLRTRTPHASNPLLGDSAGLLIGANIVPTPTQFSGTSGTNLSMSRLFAGIINNDGVSLPWVQAQIQAILSASTQANVVRMIGCSAGIGQGLYSLTAYIQAWQAIVAYCRSMGVALYPAVDSGWSFVAGYSTSGAYPSAGDLANIIAVAQALEQTDGCVGLDIIQEWTGPPSGQTTTQAQAQCFSIVSALRAAGVALPLTCSSAITTNASDLASAFSPASEAANYDFIDRHIYNFTPTPANWAALAATIGASYNRIPILVGETGIPASASGAARTAFFNGVGTYLRGGRVVGALAWAIADQDTVSTNEWGLYSGSPGGALAARTDVCPSFLAWPRRRQAPGAHVCGVGNQVLGTGFPGIQTPTTTFDDGGFTNGVSSGNPVIIPCGLGGRYRVTVQVQFTNSAGAGTYRAFITTGTAGGPTILEADGAFLTGEVHTATCSRVVDLPDNTSLWFTVNQSAASTTTVAGEQNTFVSLERVSP